MENKTFFFFLFFYLEMAHQITRNTIYKLSSKFLHLIFVSQTSEQACRRKTIAGPHVVNDNNLLANHGSLSKIFYNVFLLFEFFTNTNIYFIIIITCCILFNFNFVYFKHKNFNTFNKKKLLHPTYNAEEKSPLKNFKLLCIQLSGFKVLCFFIIDVVSCLNV